MLYTVTLCRPWSTLIGCALLLPGNQLRTLSGLTTLSMVSFLTIAVTLALCIWTLFSGDANCVGTPSIPTFVNGNAAACSFTFAYAGQSIMLEMQSEMKQPKDFPKAVALS